MFMRDHEGGHHGRRQSGSADVMVMAKPLLACVTLALGLTLGCVEVRADNSAALGPVYAAFKTGNDLLDLCTRADPGAGYSYNCLGYVQGTADAMAFAQAFGGTVGGWRHVSPTV